MKRIAAVGALCVAWLLAGAMYVIAQDEHHEDEKARQEEKHDEHERHDDAKHAERHRIDDKLFHERFGREHHFSLGHINMVEGRRRFGYGGYTFEIVDAWPHEWAYTDKCYIDYVDGGYFLYNVAHPGIRISVTVL